MTYIGVSWNFVMEELNVCDQWPFCMLLCLA